MSPFYVSMISLGVLLVVGAFVWMVVDTGKGREETQRLEATKQEIIAIINDAELVIDELNRFSDYVITKIDEKNQEIHTALQKCDEKMERLGNIKTDKAQLQESDENAANATVTDVQASEDSFTNTAILQSKSQRKSTAKIININKRYSEVLGLAEKGLGETEIARTLKMGKGEVQLILGVNR